jgi:hypothetical protein
MEQAEADRNAGDSDLKISGEEREEKKAAMHRRMLGNIWFISELYKGSMLTIRIMHEYIKKLLGEYQNPDTEHVEALCKLMSTIGNMIDHPKAKEYIDAYFDRMAQNWIWNVRNAVKNHGIWQMLRSLSQGPFNIKEHFMITILPMLKLLVYALDLVARFFIFSLHSILDGFCCIHTKDLFDFCFD